MLVTKLTQRALERASELHDGQVRKGTTPVSFITHPVAVAGIVSKYTDGEEIIAAALLHDTIEDTAYTADEMRQEFGERVTNIVLGVTIPETREGADTNWEKDRTRYVENLASAGAESAMVAAADKIHNFATVLAQYGGNAVEFSSVFGGTPQNRLDAYGAIVDVIAEKLGAEHPLTQELQAMWRRYKTFVESL